MCKQSSNAGRNHIQANAKKILSENQQVKKNIEALKESTKFTDEKVARVQKDHKKLSEQANATSKKVTEINHSSKDLEDSLTTLEYKNHKLNNTQGISISRYMEFQSTKTKI